MVTYNGEGTRVPIRILDPNVTLPRLTQQILCRYRVTKDPQHAKEPSVVVTFFGEVLTK